MDPRMMNLLESLLLNVEVINNEVKRLHITEQFSKAPHSRQLCERIREAYLRGMETLRTIEKNISR